MTPTTRRLRQLHEIRTLVAAGRRVRAADLALIHLAEFPDDEELLDPLDRGGGPTE